MRRLEFGTQVTIAQNEICALPCDAIARISQSTFGANTFDTSNDPAMGAFVQTGNSQFDVARAFIRCNAGSCLIGVVRAG